MRRSGRASLPAAALVAALMQVAGCATAPRGAATAEPLPLSSRGAWAALVAGDHAAAARAFDEALGARPVDLHAAFGRAALREARGDDAGAAVDYLAVLEAVAVGGASPNEIRLAAAAGVRVSALLADLSSRGPLVERLEALPRAALPWPAQAALDEALDRAARRRGDAGSLGRAAVAARCVRRFELRSIPGALPNLDLLREPARDPLARRLEASGCRVTLPSLDARPGVRALRATLDLPPGDYDVVLDFAGPAAVRVAGGAWSRHGTSDVYGPRLSAVRQRLRRHRQTLDVHVGTHGGGSELRLFVVPAAPALERLLASEGETSAAAARALAALIVSDGLGDVDAALMAAEAIERHPGFAIGLVAAAAFLARDPTRPPSLAQDRARGLLLRAVGRDERLARAYRELALYELERDRLNEAVSHAERALEAAPGWWPAAAALVDAYRARGLDRDADRTLEAALTRARAAEAGVACALFTQGFRRAQQRDEPAAQERLLAEVSACDALSEVPIERLRARSALAEAERALRRLLTFTPDPQWIRSELAEVLLAQGRGADAARELAVLLASSPRDASLHLRLADARRAQGDHAGASATIAAAARLFPNRMEVRQAARVQGLPMPLDRFRVNGVEAIASFSKSGVRYDAPAVLVLDRTVVRLFEDGSQAILTHNIVRVQSKDGIERWGEVQIPEGAEVLALRTHKPDGRLLEPEEIAGKPTISAPELASGDFVEWETVEFRDPTEAFAPGFVGERFYFQSLEAPLDLSEYLVVIPEGRTLAHDLRAGAPAPTWEAGPPGTRVARFVARQRPQLFAERAAVAAIEWVPSVRVSSGASTERWARFLADQLYGIGRGSPALRGAAEAIRAAAGRNADEAQLAAAVARWVTNSIELEDALLEPATATLARGRGNRAALMVALARALGLEAHVALARSPLSAPPDGPLVVQELDDFTDLLVHFGGKAGPRFVDPRMRRAPFGYLPPGIDGAAAIVVRDDPSTAPRTQRATSAVRDRRQVALALEVSADGSAAARVTETLTGWPAIEWAELKERLGDDQAKLRQDFEQRWLNQHFAGAQLGDLAIDVTGGGEVGARLIYTFTSAQMAAATRGELKLVPSFFRSQPGRRYATEAARRTTLLVSADVPLELEARISLPKGARVLELGPAAVVTTGEGGAVRFEERREVTRAETGATAVLLRRQARLPLLRVPPQAYAHTASALRRVDPLEQAEIRFALPAPPTAAQEAPAP